MSPDLAQILVSQYSYIGMIAAATIANLFPGIPEELFLLSIGYLTALGTANFWITALFVWIGLLLADSTLYYLSYRGTRLTRIMLSKLLGVDIDTDLGFLRQHIGKIIIISRFMVHFRSIGPIGAGTIHHPYRKFITADMIALAAYVPIILAIGRYFHGRIERIVSGTEDLKQIFAIMVIIVVGSAILIRLKKVLFRIIRENPSDRIRSFFGFSKKQD